MDRICRTGPDGDIEFYASKKLGRFRQRPGGDFLVLRQALRDAGRHADAADQAWVLSEASFRLRAQGRFVEALPAMRAACGWRRKRRTGVMPRSPRPISARPNCSSARSPPPWRRRNNPSPLRTAAATNFKCWSIATIHADALHAAGRARKGRASCSPTPSGGRRNGNPNSRCSIPCGAIAIATCCCRRATTPPRATGRPEPWNG